MVRQKRRKVMLVVVCVLGFLLLFIIGQLLFVKFNGEIVAAPKNIPRDQTFSTGKQLTFIVLGDSTSVSQGGDYNQGIAVQTAQFIAKQGNQVTLHNYGVSGARTKDVATKQLPQITTAPDIVLISISANDITHFTSVTSVQKDMEAIINELRQKNPDVRIVITGTPAMGSAQRFPQPLRWLAGKRTQQMNTMFTELATKESLENVQIAQKLGPMFAKNSKLFAADKFHPNTAGYKLWVQAVNKTVETVL
jgi:acyl-CoA thioesterase I